MVSVTILGKAIRESLPLTQIYDLLRSRMTFCDKQSISRISISQCGQHRNNDSTSPVVIEL